MINNTTIFKSYTGRYYLSKLKNHAMDISAALLGMIIGSLLVGWCIEFIWNSALVSTIDGIHSITYWQAVGLTWLCHFLFGSSK